jgi:hypothetical protein
VALFLLDYYLSVRGLAPGAEGSQLIGETGIYMAEFIGEV